MIGKTTQATKYRFKTLDPICVPNGTIGELIEARENGLSMAKFGEYVAFVYPDEIEQVSEPNNH